MAASRRTRLGFARLAACLLVGGLGVGWLGIGCASSRSCSSSDKARAVACRTYDARAQLVFGMSRADAVRTLGSATVVPPWRTDLGDVPVSLSNPFDNQTIRSEIGEEYEVVRFFVEVDRVSKCPFLQGWVRFEPLVFLNDRLVGWEWAYVAGLLGSPVTNEMKYSSFGIFCDRERSNAEAEPAD